jgi:hypothetical protein
METEIKSGEQIVDDFFANIERIAGVESNIAKLFSTLHLDKKLTDANVKNGLLSLREKNATEN